MPITRTRPPFHSCVAARVLLLCARTTEGGPYQKNHRECKWRHDTMRLRGQKGGPKTIPVLPTISPARFPPTPPSPPPPRQRTPLSPHPIRFRFVNDIRHPVHVLPRTRKTAPGRGGQAEEAGPGQGHQVAGAVLLPVSAAHQLGAGVHRFDGVHVGLLVSYRESQSLDCVHCCENMEYSAATRRLPTAMDSPCVANTGLTAACCTCTDILLFRCSPRLAIHQWEGDLRSNMRS